MSGLLCLYALWPLPSSLIDAFSYSSAAYAGQDEHLHVITMAVKRFLDHELHLCMALEIHQIFVVRYGWYSRGGPGSAVNESG